MSSGIRMRNGLLKTVPLEEVKALFESDGFVVTGVERTARMLSVSLKVTLDLPPVGRADPVPTELGATFLIGEETITFRWNKLSPKVYYHIRQLYRSIADTNEARAIRLWRSKYGTAD